MNSCIDNNQKTIKSADFTTDCPNRRAGKTCKYCYVESARKTGFNAKKVEEYRPYKGEALRMKQETIDKLNKAGGIRMFSFGDFMEEHSPDIQSFLDDCEKVGLKAKAITKQVNFISRFHDHPAIQMIHISVDNIGCGVPHGVAKAYRRKFNKVRIRSVITKDEDLEALDFSDIYTFFHGHGEGFKNYREEEKKSIAKRYNIVDKTCCLINMSKQEQCDSCSVKCGLNRVD